MRMKAAVLTEQGRPRPFAASRPLSVEEVDLEGPGPGEVLVEMRAAGLCHSDLSAIRGDRARQLPTIPGHEGAGIVREVGSGVTRFRPGDHVVTVFVASCGTCPACAGGRPNLCDTSWSSRSAGTLISGGRRLSLRGNPVHHSSGISAFAEYAVTSIGSLVRVDSDVPIEDAALFGCAVMTGVGAVANTAQMKMGAVAAVVGLGGVGLNSLMGAVAAGASRIYAVDINPDKLDLARNLGATDTVRADDPRAVEQVRQETGGGVEYAFEMAGKVAALSLAYALLRRGGMLVTAGLPGPGERFPIAPAEMVSNEIQIRGSYMGSCIPSRDIPRYIDLYRRGRLPVDRLRSGFVGLEEINEGFDRLADGQVVRQILRCTSV